MANIGSRYAPTPISVALAPVQRMSALSPNDYMRLLQGPVSGFEAPDVPSIDGLPSANDVLGALSIGGMFGAPALGQAAALGKGAMAIATALGLISPSAPSSISPGKGLFGFLSSVVDDLSLAPTAPTSISNSEDMSLGTSSIGDLGFGFDMGLDLGLGSDDSDDGANVGGED